MSSRAEKLRSKSLAQFDLGLVERPIKYGHPFQHNFGFFSRLRSYLVVNFFWIFATIALSFLFNKHYSIMK